MKKNKAFVLAAISIAIVAFFSLKLIPKPQQRPKSASTPTAGSFVTSHSPSFGNTLARVTVVEWFDPECESCRMIHPALKKIIKDYEDRVHFVFRYMPNHEGSMFAASVLEEAREIGKFEEALDILFDKQPEWGDHQKPRPDLIPSYVAALGIPKEKLDKEYLIKKHGDKIQRDQSDGRAVGVRGTPTFFVNQEMLSELGDEPLREAIEAGLAREQ